jgi:probable F420-dependent oxidoreductase
MRFFYQYPETLGGDADMLDAGPVAELAEAAERAGWHGFAFTEHPAPSARWLAAGGHQTLDPFVALGHVAAVTRALRLLTYLAVVPYRNPLLLAKAAATLDRLSDGRLVLGIGSGYLKAEFQALGVDFDERNTLVDETLDVLGGLWSGTPFSYRGRHFDARDVVSAPRPRQDPIPIWIGGNSARTRRRVARRADGWLPLTSHADLSATTRTPHIGSVEELAVMIRDLRDEAGDRGEQLDVAIAYTDPTIAAPGREVERHREALGRYAEIGVTCVIVPAPATGRGRTRDLIDEFASLYITPS